MSSAAAVARRLAAPALGPGGHDREVWNAYGALRIPAAVNLAEDRRYRDQPVHLRLELAAKAQQSFLNELLNPSLDAVFDLRILSRPDDPALDVALLIRAFAETEGSARRRLDEITSSVERGMPDHVLAAAVDDAGEVERLLAPFGDGASLDAAFIAKDEIIGFPQREDVRAQVEYFYSVVPFNHVANDWSTLYQRLSALRQPVVVSVALAPVATPTTLANLLEAFAMQYQQWASGDRAKGALYSGERALAPEAFATDAAPVFADYAQRLRRQAFATRILVAAPNRLPVGLVEALAATISPIEHTDTGHLQGRRAATGYAIRSGAAAAELARWDLAVADVCMPPGRPEIWGRDIPPPQDLAALPILGDARDAASAFRLPIAATGDLPGIKVRRGRSGQAEATSGGARPILIGDLYDGSGQLLFDADSLSKHALIAGSTGSGKTTVVLEILRQLWTGLPPDAEGRPQRIPWLAIEPVNAEANDYRKFASLEGFEDLEVYTVADERFRPLRFNPFAVPDGVLVREHMASLLDCFKAAFGLWDPLPAIYEEAIADTYMANEILPSEIAGDVPGRLWPTVVHFEQAMTAATEDLGYKGDVRANLEAASVIRAKQLVSGPCASAFRTHLPLDIDHLMQRPVVIELKALGSTDEQALLIAMLLSAITSHYKANRGAQRHLQHVTVIEEAHRLLARAKGASAGSSAAQAKEQAAEGFANVLAENRKYGEGIIIAEQIPSKLVEDAVKNTNLKVMCRLTSEEERTYLGQTMAMTPEQAGQAARLTTGQALVYADEIANATEVRTGRTITVDVPATVPIHREPPLSGCTLCPARCHYRATGLALSRRPRVVTRAAALSAASTGRANGASKEEVAARRAKAQQALVRVVVNEVGRYPALANGGVAAAAVCTALHALDGRVTQSRLESTVAAVQRTVETMPVP